jgi:hypothetical protein
MEVQNNVVTAASDGEVLAELDTNKNTKISTDVSLTESDSYTLKFDIQPRDGGSRTGHEDSSDMKVTFGDMEVSINSDKDGNLTYECDNPNVTVNLEEANSGWTTVTLEYTHVEADHAELSFEGTGGSDSFGMLLDNINLTDITEHSSGTHESEWSSYEAQQDDGSCLFEVSMDHHGSVDHHAFMAESAIVKFDSPITSTEFSVDSKGEFDIKVFDHDGKEFDCSENTSIDPFGNISISGVEDGIGSISIEGDSSFTCSFSEIDGKEVGSIDFQDAISRFPFSIGSDFAPSLDFSHDTIANIEGSSCDLESKEDVKLPDNILHLGSDDKCSIDNLLGGTDNDEDTSADKSSHDARDIATSTDTSATDSDCSEISSGDRHDSISLQVDDIDHHMM